MTEPGIGLDLDGLVADSETLFAARLTDDGVVEWANATLQSFAGRDVTGAPIGELLTEPQRPAFERALAAAGETWRSITVGFTDGSPRAADDRRVFLRRQGGDVALVAEPAQSTQQLLIEQVLELNEDLIAAQRSVSRRQRELERAQAEAATAMERVRRLESIMLAGLTRPTLEGVLEALLEIASDVIGSVRSAILLRDEDRRVLALAAATGVHLAGGADLLPLGRGFAGRIALEGRGLILDADDAVSTDLPFPSDAGGSLAGVPLVLEQHVIGVLLISSPTTGEFGAEDLALLERIGERAALAIGHAQLRDRERAVAEALQRSLLPDRLPDVPDVKLAARYLSRAAGVDVGGDFYDAVTLDDKRLSLAIGDVAGKGLQAASIMGRLRNAVRAYAVENDGPEVVLRLVDRLAYAEEAMATAQHLVFDATTGVVVYANAGHPPGLRVSREGVCTWLDKALAPPLGTDWSRRTSATTRLDPGDRLLFFTDGLVERRDELLDAGLDRVCESASGAGDEDLEGFCDRVLEALRIADGFEDDVALLAVEWSPS